MARRLLELALPADLGEVARKVLADIGAPEPWQERAGEDRVLVRLLLEAEESGAVLDAIETRFRNVEGFHAILLAVEASLPRPQPADPEPEEDDPSVYDTAKSKPPLAGGLSREELYADVVDMAVGHRTFVLMVVLSSLVAAVGLLRDSVAVIIGAMVIAPLLGPNVALAFATTLGDLDLLKKSLRSNAIGVILALALSILLGLALHVEKNPEILSRTNVEYSDIVLALASGAAGVLALTSGASATLVGVMVAVALMPPTVVLGLMLGAADWPAAAGALMLLATNVICVNLAGVLTFFAQGVRPLTWWEADQARASMRRALVLWVGLLAVLAALIGVR